MVARFRDQFPSLDGRGGGRVNSYHRRPRGEHVEPSVLPHQGGGSTSSTACFETAFVLSFDKLMTRLSMLLTLVVRLGTRASLVLHSGHTTAPGRD
jgi:hypothetical protein